MKTNKQQNQYKQSNRYGKYENMEDVDKIFRTSESTVPKSSKNKPKISIIAYIKNIIKSIFFRNNKNKSTISNSATNNSEYFLSSQHRSPDETISTSSLQSNATKLAEDNNINTIKDNNPNISLTFSTFDKESKNSNQHIVKDNGRRSSSPPPPIRTSSLNKNSSTPALQTNSTKLAQDDNASASLDLSTFGKETNNSDQDIAKDKGARLSSPPPPIRTSSLNRSKGKNSNIRR